MACKSTENGKRVYEAISRQLSDEFPDLEKEGSGYAQRTDTYEATMFEMRRLLRDARKHELVRQQLQKERPGEVIAVTEKEKRLNEEYARKAEELKEAFRVGMKVIKIRKLQASLRKDMEALINGLSEVNSTLDNVEHSVSSFDRQMNMLMGEMKTVPHTPCKRKNVKRKLDF